MPHDERFFPQTGYGVDDDAISGYFQARGGVGTFGYPISRPFLLLGCHVQFFQRQIAQVCDGQGVSLMNLLDPDLFPYTAVNGSTFPAPDDALKAAAPKVDDPDYAAAVIAFVRDNAPDTFDGQPVNFGSTFFGSISPDQAGTDDPNLLALLDLEIWGVPISQPIADPNNPSFIYQRFQRGIMHYDASIGATQGILLTDYLKELITGEDVPADLQVQAQGSRFLGQYCPGAAGWLCRPADLPGTDLTNAFATG